MDPRPTINGKPTLSALLPWQPIDPLDPFPVPDPLAPPPPPIFEYDRPGGPYPTIPNPVDGFPYWRRSEYQQAYKIQDDITARKLEDLRINQDPHYIGVNVPSNNVSPRPVSLSGPNQIMEAPFTSGQRRRGTYGPTLTDYFWQTQGYIPDPTQYPGGGS